MAAPIFSKNINNQSDYETISVNPFHVIYDYEVILENPLRFIYGSRCCHSATKKNETDPPFPSFRLLPPTPPLVFDTASHTPAPLGAFLMRIKQAQDLPVTTLHGPQFSTRGRRRARCAARPAAPSANTCSARTGPRSQWRACIASL